MKHSRRDFIHRSGMAALVLSRGCVLDAAALSPGSEASSSTRTLFFEQPADEWTTALPVGNGWLGAMLYGVPMNEHIQISNDSLWDGEVRNRNNPRAAEAVPEIRKLLFDGKMQEAERLATTSMLAIPRRMPMNETLGDLWIDFHLPGTFGVYRRDLDLRTAIAGIGFQSGEVKFRREVFSSAPDRVVVMRMEASRKASLSFTARLDRPASFSTTTDGTNKLGRVNT